MGPAPCCLLCQTAQQGGLGFEWCGPRPQGLHVGVLLGFTEPGALGLSLKFLTVNKWPDGVSLPSLPLEAVTVLFLTLWSGGDSGLCWLRPRDGSRLCHVLPSPISPLTASLGLPDPWRVGRTDCFSTLLLLREGRSAS